MTLQTRGGERRDQVSPRGSSLDLTGTPSVVQKRGLSVKTWWKQVEISTYTVLRSEHSQ